MNIVVDGGICAETRGANHNSSLRVNKGGKGSMGSVNTGQKTFTAADQVLGNSKAVMARSWVSDRYHEEPHGLESRGRSRESKR